MADILSNLNGYYKLDDWATTPSPTVVKFETPGGQTWTCPAGVYAILVQCWGGGGAGGGASISAFPGSGGGGGGGGFAQSTFPVTPGNGYFLCVANGGLGVDAGTSGQGGGAGENSYFNTDTTIFAAGGDGGFSSVDVGAGGVGGGSGAGANPPNIGGTVFNGGAGGTADEVNFVEGGGGGGAGTTQNGGDGGIDAGGTGGSLYGGNGSISGQDTGFPYGGGGTGENNLLQPGGNGGNGAVIITYYTNNIADSSGLGNNLQAVGNYTLGVAGTAPALPRAVSFDGTTNAIISSAVPVITATDNWTICGWINPANLSQIGFAVNAGGGSSVNVDWDGYGFGVGAGNGGTGGNLEGVYSNIAWIDSGYTFPSANTWYHVIMQRTSGTLKFYVNNVDVGTPTFFGGTTPIAPTGTSIGSIQDIYPFAGQVQEARFFNRALSSADRAALYAYRGTNQGFF